MLQPGSAPSYDSSQSVCLFTSLGGVVLDQLELPDGKLSDVLGGAGVYATLGARLVLRGHASFSVGWFLRLGHDFPDHVLDQLKLWSCSTIFSIETNEPCTRARLSYDRHGSKKFEYLTPPLRTTPNNLSGTPNLHSLCFHFLGSPEEILKHVPKLLSLRQAAGNTDRPLLVWEPLTASCVPRCLDEFKSAVKLVDVFSPNHVELAQIYGAREPETVDTSSLQRHAETFLAYGIGPHGKGLVVVRAGERGCMVNSRSHREQWFPAFYDGEHECVDTQKMDPTGAGNTFLGAFAIGMLQSRDSCQAAIMGSVAASFAIEQIGVPSFETDETYERWNGDSFAARLDRYMSRVRATMSAGSTQFV